jgi:F420H(2)-dependent biliverdin reductase
MPSLPPQQLSGAARRFLTERHLATLTTLRADGSPHVVPVGFTYDEPIGIVRIITRAGSVKAFNAARGGRAVVSSFEGGRWITLEGTARVSDDPVAVAEAVRRYAERYRQPGERADRVAIEIEIDAVLCGRAMMEP